MLINEFDIHRMREQIQPWHLYYWTKLDSTSSWALQQNQQGDFHRPGLVLARHQTAGRGRGDRVWQADSGSITASWVLDRPANPVTGNPLTPGQLAIMSAIAVRRALARWITDSPIQLKWPNDIYIERRKVSGILIESVIGLSTVDVIGIGINVNNRVELISLRDSAIANAPTSMAEILGQQISLTDVLLAVHTELVEVAESQRQSWSDLLSEYQSHLAGFGKQVELTNESQSWSGRIMGIDDSGALLVESGHQVSAIVAGSICSIDW